MEEIKKLAQKPGRVSAFMMLFLSAVLILTIPVNVKAQEKEKPKTDVMIGISAELTTKTTIKVLDGSKKPVKNARLSLYVKAGNYKGFLPIGVTLSDGTYTIKLPHGTYRCKVEADGYDSAEGEFILNTSDTARTFTISMNKKEEEQLVTVAIVAKFTDGSPAAGYGIELHSKVQKGVLDESGYGVFNNVELGDHSIFLFDRKGKEAASTSFVLAKSDAVKLEGKDVVKVGLDTQMLTIDLEIDPETGMVNLVRAREGNHVPAPVITKTVNREVVTTHRTVIKTKKAGLARTADNVAGAFLTYVALLIAAAAGLAGALRRQIGGSR